MVEISGSYEFGEFQLSPARRELKKTGILIPVERKVMDLLIFLIENRDRMVTKDEIQDEVWPGTIVTETALTRAIMKARRAVDDSAVAQRVIKTVHGEGYRFVADVVLNSHKLSQPGPQVAPPTPRWIYAVMFAGLLGVFALAMALIPFRDAQEGPIAERTDEAVARSSASIQAAQPVLAVLPFENLSPDPEHGYFASGIQEEIMNELSRGTSLRVIARTSVAQYSNTTKTIPQIASELGAASIVEGSVRYTDDRVRIAAQLVDGKSGIQLWSESYDRAFADIFQIQSDIAREVASALEAEVFGISHEHDEPERVLAYKEYLLARSLRYRTFEVGWEPVLEHVDKSLAHDPGFLPSLAILHNAYQNRIIGDSHEDANAKMQAITQRAIQRDPQHPITLSLRAKDAAYQWRWDEAVRYWDEALRKDPNDPDNLGTAAMINLASGSYDHAATIVMHAVETNPLHDWGHYADMLLRLARRDVDGAYEVGDLIISMGGNRAFPAAATLAMYSADRGEPELVRRYGETLVSMTSVGLQPLVDGLARHATGEERLSHELIARMLETSPPPNTYKWMAVQTHLMSGRIDEAFAVLDDIAASRAVFSVLRVVSDPAFETLWSDPRFDAFLESVGMSGRPKPA